MVACTGDKDDGRRVRGAFMGGSSTIDTCEAMTHAPLFLTAKCCLPLCERSSLPVAVTLNLLTALFLGLSFVCTF